jgi:hypothetical protein
MLIDTEKLRAVVTANRFAHKNDADALVSIERFENALLLIQKVAEKLGLVESESVPAKDTPIISREEIEKARLFTSGVSAKKSSF